MTEAAPRKRILVWVLLGLSALAVALTVYDAVAAAAAAVPKFLFLLVLPNLLDLGGRLTSLAAHLALPALAAGLPILVLGVGLLLRMRGGPPTRAARSRTPWLVGGAGLLVLGLGADLALLMNKRLVARPQDDAGRLVRDGGPRPDTPEVTPPPPKPGVEKIVFASDRRDGKWDLWTMNPDGSGAERLSKTGRVHMQPRFSPDGTRLTFTSTGPGGEHLVMLLDWATRKESRVCEGGQSSFDGDGKGLVFRRGGRIWHRSLQTGEERRVSPATWSKCSFPSASPDGKTVALASLLLAGYNIYLVPLAGGEPRTLVSGKGTCDPRWSPTGRWLSYQTETHVFMIRPDGTEKFQVTIGGGVQHYAAWSPDEKAVAYCQGPGPNGPWQVWRVSLEEDEDPVQLTTEGSNIYPDWGRVPAAEGNE